MRISLIPKSEQTRSETKDCGVTNKLLHLSDSFLCHWFIIEWIRPRHALLRWLNWIFYKKIYELSKTHLFENENFEKENWKFSDCLVQCLIYVHCVGFKRFQTLNGYKCTNTTCDLHWILNQVTVPSILPQVVWHISNCFGRSSYCSAFTHLVRESLLSLGFPKGVIGPVQASE